MNRAERVVILSAVLAGLCGAGRADEVVLTNGLKYDNVQVTGVKDCNVIFHKTTQEITKSVKDIASVSIKGLGALDEAEKLAKDGKVAEAVRAYGDAMRQASDSWQKKLIEYRRYQAMARSGAMIDQAVQAWLTMLEECRGSATAMNAAVEIKPSEFAPKGSPENDRAIKAMKRKEHADKPYAGAVRQLLMELCRHEGRSAEAAELAEEITAEPKSQPAGGDKKADRTSGGGRDGLEGQLKAAEVFLQQGETARALGVVKANLSRYNDNDLPTALLLMGKAQYALYRTEARAERKENLLIEAGLNLMKVFANFPSSPAAAEALYMAGRVNASPELKNRAGARAAYETVIRQYGASPFAAKAKEDLDKLINE